MFTPVLRTGVLCCTFPGGKCGAQEDTWACKEEERRIMEGSKELEKMEAPVTTGRSERVVIAGSRVLQHRHEPPPLTFQSSMHPDLIHNHQPLLVHTSATLHAAQAVLLPVSIIQFLYSKNHQRSGRYCLPTESQNKRGTSLYSILEVT